MAPLASWACYPVEAFLCTEGLPADAMFLLEKGRVALTFRGDGPSADVLDVAEAGETIGWSWFLPPHVWKLSARALEPVEAWRVPGPALRRLAEGDPELSGALASRLLDVVAGRLHSTRLKLAESRRVAAGRPIRVEVVAPDPKHAGTPAALPGI